ncbi:hypothetical protein M316_0021 [Nitrincola phage 1M3-16]|uniref:hypothetical protein n=1 Tax=Nitrincola phage 1M3-16 TaxID=1472912 RepID=UPI000444C86E|nr:hypothetical protein GJ22_gp131 [Nitrincola phage 1M3-16]AHX01086.1 hypothetical protein M316_0021 [Nitrincola phage 1M3-16]
MKIDIDNPSQLLSHIMLSDREISEKVAETSNWKENGAIDAKASFNGVEVDGSVLEKVLQEFVKQIEDYFVEKYDADEFDRRVEEKAEAIIKEHADNAAEKLSQLSRVLEEHERLLKPYWQRDSNRRTET